MTKQQQQFIITGGGGTEQLVINTGEVEAQLREDLNLPPLVTRRQPHPTHLETLNPVNKRLKHPD